MDKAERSPELVELLFSLKKKLSPRKVRRLRFLGTIASDAPIDRLSVGVVE